jgi:hypothetical protein
VSAVFWDATLRTLVELRHCFGGIYWHYFQRRRVCKETRQQESWACLQLPMISCFDYSSILKMEVIYSSETLVCLQIAWHQSPEELSPHHLRWENFKPSLGCLVDSSKRGMKRERERKKIRKNRRRAGERGKSGEKRKSINFRGRTSIYIVQCWATDGRQL